MGTPTTKKSKIKNQPMKPPQKKFYRLSDPAAVSGLAAKNTVRANSAL
jgi:hypothetical protein